jgi:enoyl-CoA hydratase
MLLQNNEIFFENLLCRSGILGIATLNRPKRLNALSHEMIQALETQLDQWAQDSTVKAVLIQSNSEKAFCAGGDILYVYQSRQKGEYVNEFFGTEYRLNQKIHEYPKPYIAFLDGITMGGGVGISIHGSHRVGTEKLVLSMPETGIGFFPDVGASYFLSHCKNALGVYMGLTGARLNIADASYVELIDHYIPSGSIEAVKADFLTTELDFSSKTVVSAILCSHAVQPPQAELALHADCIAEIFASTHVEEIFAQLSSNSTPFAQETLNILKKKSPTSLKVTREELLRGMNQTIDECIQMEFQLAKNFLHSHDFFEGIRAVLVDKDHTPHWQPESLEKVTEAKVVEFFRVC